MPVRALLILDGVNPESHGGAVTTLGLRFIRNEQLSVSVAKVSGSILRRVPGWAHALAVRRPRHARPVVVGLLPVLRTGWKEAR
ncbi:MAG: hypothetical protein OXQ90_09680 [Gammaproteobacteria bacterium]|nr:hypothetical protein [Gammaproteobacteria bacterium]